MLSDNIGPSFLIIIAIEPASLCAGINRTTRTTAGADRFRLRTDGIPNAVSARKMTSDPDIGSAMAHAISSSSNGRHPIMLAFALVIDDQLEQLPTVLE